jgi:hypothetical protein
MKRDMELIRLVLKHYETGDSPPALTAFSESEIFYNCMLMNDAGLIVANFTEGSGVLPVAITNVRLTWAGHDFLDAARNDTIWKMAKDKILKPGASWTFSLLAEFLKQEASRQIFGVPPGG